MSTARLPLCYLIPIALLCVGTAPAQDNRLFDEEAHALSQAVRDGDRSAIEKLRAMAENGSPYAQLMFASTLEAVNHDEWMKWNLAAAMQGQPVAQINIGGAYSHGSNSAEREKAVFWLKLAADQGKWFGAGLLGDLYRGRRRDEPGDFVQAYRWYTVGVRIAKEDSREDVVKPLLDRRDYIAKSMTPPQIAEAESLAAQWVRRDWSELKPRLEELR